ncbi:ArgS-related anticodon-binding protein NrtL [Streptomyces sp. MS06]|uniref:ArgS-related anticodon-binding protein NrtL n=1 Tax=Streptomyces sp. MS06 TaxID=3385974 RepID=UPI00399F481D
MTPAELSRTVLHAVRCAVDQGELSVAVPARAVVAAPGPGGCGDYATAVALQLARPAGRPPRDVAAVLRAHLLRSRGVTGVEITGPGFLNISLVESGWADLVRRILREGPRYGHGDALAGSPVLRLSVPDEVRAEVVADAVARIAASQGGRVVVEAGAAGDGARRLDAGGGTRPGSGAALDGTHPDRDTHPGTGATPADPDCDRGTPVVLRPVPAPQDPAPLGADAARWALLYPAAHDRPRVGAEHLVQREANPLFRVRYAHARVRSLHRNAADLGFEARPGAVDGGDDASSVSSALVALLADHPRVLAAAAARRAPDRLARHLVAVADAVMPVLPGVLPCGAEKPSAAHRARLALAEAAGTVLAGGLSLLGIDAPDHL